MTLGGERPARSLFPRNIWKPLVLCVAVLCAVGSTSAQLSPNSGINTADTWAVFDITIQGRGTTALAQPLYNPYTQTTVSTLDFTLNVRHFRVELGYDLDDQLVVNVLPTDPPCNPMQSNCEDISRVEFRKGKLTVFDGTGTPIAISLSNNAPLPQVLALLGAIPGSSVLNSLVLSDVSAEATAMNGTLWESYETTTSSRTIGGEAFSEGTQVRMAYISYSPGSPANGTGTLSYQQFSGGWALSESRTNIAVSSTQLTQTARFTNLWWSDNPTGNSRRAAKLTPAAPMPPFTVSDLTAPPFPSPASNCPRIQVEVTNQGPTNLLYQHGIFSDASAWDRMDPWTRSDFPFAAVAKSSLCSTSSLTSQANDLMSLIQGSGRSNFLAIGHSQGGLVVRDVAFRSNNFLIDRVITLDTPNNGAWIAEWERATLAGSLVRLVNFLVTMGSGTPFPPAVATVPSEAYCCSGFRR